MYCKCFPRWIVGREFDLRRIGRQPCLGLAGRIIVDDFDVDLILLQDHSPVSVVDAAAKALSSVLLGTLLYMKASGYPSAAAPLCGPFVIVMPSASDA